MYCTRCGVGLEEKDRYCFQCGQPTALARPIRASTDAPRQLFRPTRGRALAGVCSGVALYFGLDITLVRVLWLLSLLIPGPTVIAYIVCWIVVPNEHDLWAVHTVRESA